jgi:hypothetical protein
VQIREKAVNRQNKILEDQETEATKRREKAAEANQKAIEEEIKMRQDIYYANNKTQEEEYQDFLEAQKKKEETLKASLDIISAYRDEERDESEDAHIEKLFEIEEEKQAVIEAERLKQDAKAKAAQEAVSMAAQTGQQILDMANFMLDAERGRLEQQKAYELQMAGDNKERIAEVNEKYAKREAELKTKQAKADKAAAIFKAIINIAQSITAMLGAGPVGIVLAALSAAMGAVQLGVIASTPIPQFFKGTESGPDGVISLGEKGRELIKTKSGQLLLANDQTLATGLRGAKIFTNRETEAMLRGGAFGYDSQELRNTLERNNDKLIRTIQNKKEIHINTTKREITERSGRYYTTYKNRYFK